MAREEKSNVINRDMNKDEKLKALDAALTQIEKAYGKGSVMKLGYPEISWQYVFPASRLYLSFCDIADSPL